MRRLYKAPSLHVASANAQSMRSSLVRTNILSTGRGAAWAGKARKAVRARAAATAARSEADVVGTQALMRKAERLEEKAREAEREAEVAEEKGIKARDDRVTLFKNLRDWGCEVSPGQFDMIKYSARYCDIDTQVHSRAPSRPLATQSCSGGGWLKRVLVLDSY